MSQPSEAAARRERNGEMMRRVAAAEVVADQIVAILAEDDEVFERPEKRYDQALALMNGMGEAELLAMVLHLGQRVAEFS